MPFIKFGKMKRGKVLRTEVTELVQGELLQKFDMELVAIEGEIQARDLDSRNGVYLNGLRIHAVILRNGDVLQCGDVVFEYKEGA